MALVGGIQDDYVLHYTSTRLEDGSRDTFW
jgi:hypothetical protein